jgi:hypothetical protein
LAQPRDRAFAFDPPTVEQEVVMALQTLFAVLACIATVWALAVAIRRVCALSPRRLLECRVDELEAQNGQYRKACQALNATYGSGEDYHRSIATIRQIVERDI